MEPDLANANRSNGQWLARHARVQPTAIAIANGDTWHALALNVLRVRDALAETGIRRGHVLGIETPDRYLHLLIMLAAETLAASTISIVPSEFEPPISIGRLCDRILVATPLATSDSAKTTVLTVDWITAALARGMDETRLPALEHDVAPDTMMRLCKSSGTTGLPKVMGLTQRMLQRIIQHNFHDLPDHVRRHPHYLCLYDFTVRACYWRSLLTLRAGGTIHLAGSDNLWDLILRGAGNYVSFLSGDLARFVQTAPAGYGPFQLRIDVTGAPVPFRLRQEARRKISNDLCVTYSANEVQRISLVGDDGIGRVLPEVRVTIVDERGRPVPMGQTGVIRARSDTMVDGYIGAPELTAAAFVDGWYHTNDIGYQPREGQLVVLGRADDMLNVGGVKIAPGPLEERLRTIPGVLDAVVTGIDANLGTNTLLIGIETAIDAGCPRLRHLVNQMAGEYTTDFRIMVVRAFPRTATRKIRRDEIKAVYRRHTSDGIV